jgi:hypothetical protein
MTHEITGEDTRSEVIKALDALLELFRSAPECAVTEVEPVEVPPITAPPKKGNQKTEKWGGIPGGLGTVYGALEQEKEETWK